MINVTNHNIRLALSTKNHDRWHAVRRGSQAIGQIATKRDFRTVRRVEMSYKNIFSRALARVLYD